MARRKPSQAVRAGRQPLPAWVWLTAGFALGVLVSGLLIFRDWRHEQRGSATAGAAQTDSGILPPATPGTNAPAGAATVPDKPKLEFYQALRDREVIIPDEDLRAAVAKPAQPAEANVRYWLQVGSFPQAQEAEGLKARLALQGVKVQIAPVTLDGITWHRVRTGPYADARAVEDAKRGLQASNIESFAYKERTD